MADQDKETNDCLVQETLKESMLLPESHKPLLTSSLAGFGQGSLSKSHLVEEEEVVTGKPASYDKRRTHRAAACFVILVLCITVRVSIWSFQEKKQSINRFQCGTFSKSQTDYRGSINVSWSGKTCQRWDVQEPHMHTRTADRYPGSGLEENYCRNPDGEQLAWCYTTDSKSRWEHCNVPLCEALDFNGSNTNGEEHEEHTIGPEQCGSLPLGQVDYRGDISTTESGRTCQAWTEQFPHEHTRTAENYPNANLTSNFCRNPDGEARAWCYTTDPDTRWEFCKVPDCPTGNSTCGSYDRKQEDYVGSINVTVSGTPCQPWAEQIPHYHLYLPALMPESNLVGNACRNPTGDEKGAWCYTSDPQVIWEYCDVPYCQTKEERERSFACGSKKAKQSDYRGTMAITKSGRRCQHWDSDFPRFPEYKIEDYPFLESNYCRNPNGDKRAWCYTDDIRTPKEYCNVSICAEEESCGENCTHCGSSSENQADYRGRINVTVSGLVCQEWTAQTPNSHTRTPEEYPYAGLTGNACRNPDGEASAWCYTISNETRWEHCDVPLC